MTRETWRGAGLGLLWGRGGGRGVAGSDHAPALPPPHLLHVDAARQEVGRDQHAGRPRPELAHDDVARVLVHVAVRRRHGVVALAHLVGQPVDLAPRVGEDDRLGDGQRFVQVAQGVELPLLALGGGRRGEGVGLFLFGARRAPRRHRHAPPQPLHSPTSTLT